MINNFICFECKKYKSHGKPVNNFENSKWICLDCYKILYLKRGKVGGKYKN